MAGALAERTGLRLRRESTMDTLLVDLAFAVFMLAQVSAVIAVHAEWKRRGPEELDAARMDHLTRLIRNSGG